VAGFATPFRYSFNDPMRLLRLPAGGFVIFWLQIGDACHSDCTFHQRMLTIGRVVECEGQHDESPKSVRSTQQLVGYSGSVSGSVF
jgi:hypothetical protein